LSAGTWPRLLAAAHAGVPWLSLQVMRNALLMTGAVDEATLAPFDVRIHQLGRCVHTCCYCGGATALAWPAAD
jgi:hypothetical protein